MEENAILKFTYEIGNSKIPFLDVDVSAKSDKVITKAYKKPADKGWCLNGKSECPDRYKISAIQTYIRRAHKISPSGDLFNQELDKMKRVL